MADIVTLPIDTPASIVALAVEPAPASAPIATPFGSTLASNIELNETLSVVEYGVGNYDVNLTWTPSTATANGAVTSLAFPAGTIPTAFIPSTTNPTSLPSVVTVNGALVPTVATIGTNGSLTFNTPGVAATNVIGLTESQLNWRVLAA